MTLATAIASVVIGVSLLFPSIRARSGPWLGEFRRFLSGASLVFLVGHMATLWIDSTAGFGWRELLIPGESSWEPEAVSWGIIAAWSLVAVHLISLAREHVSDFVWRSIHILSIVTMVAGAYHAWLGGTDVDNPLTWLVAGLGSVIVVVLVSIRLRDNDDTPPGEERPSELEILQEMRDRLENLPIPDATPTAQLTVEPASTLPRRAPAAESTAPTGLDEPAPVIAGAVTAKAAFTSDPFAAVPLGNDSSELGGWLDRSSNDPFDGQAIDPFRNNTPTPEADDMAFQPGVDPFGSEPAPPPPIPAPQPVVSEGDLFGPATEEEERIDDLDFPELPPLGAGKNPFSPIEPTPTAISVPAEPEPAVHAGVPVGGPPPLPEAAVDPVTGKPDEAAYAAWLVEWLAYADRYGEETPDDPTRT